MKSNFLDSDHIFLDIDTTDRAAMFKQVNDVLVKDEYVTTEYLEKVIAREDEHPTGFQLRRINVAMPHVDAEYVKKNGMFLVRSKKGILFKNAETDEDLTVNIVFGLLLNDPKEHLQFLMKLASSFKDEDKLVEILNSGSKDEVKILVDSILAK